MTHLPELDGTPRGDLPAVLSAVNRFYAAFNIHDLAAMAEVWADDGVLYNPIGGIARGWEAIAALYRRLFGGPVSVQVTFFDYTLGEEGDAAWVVGRERGTARRGPEAIDLAIRTSRLFRRVGSRWQQVHHHGSIDDPALLAAYQRLVRG